MKKCLKCLTSIPAGRTKLGYKVCVKCSSVSPYSCVQVNNHKTGNTIEITDAETAKQFNRLASRKGYGIMTGMKRS